MKKAILLLAIIALLAPAGFAQEQPASADEIMNKAIEKAKQEDKDIFLMFHASWCGWCKKMDKAMNDDLCKEYFESNFITIHMVVMESAKNKHLENPGANEFLAKHGGERAGIPFWLIFDKKGKLIADSFIVKDDKKGNIGCPARDDEVAAFIDKLKLAGPVSEDEVKSITERFKQNAN